MLMDFEGKWELTIWDGGDQVFESSKTRRPWRGELVNGGRAEVGKKYTWKLVTRPQQVKSTCSLMRCSSTANNP